MGLECVPSDDSNRNDVENNDVISISSNESSSKYETFEKYIASYNFNVNINLNHNLFLKLEKKWLKCIMCKVTHEEDSKKTLNKQFIYCNSAIKYTFRKLNNYESVLLFSYIFYKYRNDANFTKSLYTLCIRWYFCLKYNFMLSSSPFLGSISTFNNLILGIRTIYLMYSSFSLLLLDVHRFSHNYIASTLSCSKNDDKSSSEVESNDWLIEVYPIFSKIQSSSELSSFCKHFVSYIFDLILSSSNHKIVLYFDESASVLDSLWDQLMLFNVNHDCECQVKTYFILLDIYSDIVFNGQLSDTARDETINSLVGLYSKWLLLMTSTFYVENSIIKRAYELFEDNSNSVLKDIQKMVDEIEFPYFNVKFEDAYQCNNVDDYKSFVEKCKNYVSCSLSVFIKRCFRLYKTYESVPIQILVLSSAYVNYESDKYYDVGKDLQILGGASFMEPFTFSLYRHEIGRNVLSKCQSRVYYTRFEEIGECIASYKASDDYNYDVVCEYCYRIYSSIASSCRYDLDSKRLKMCISTTTSSKVSLSYIHYEFPKNDARVFLNTLVKVIEAKISSVNDLNLCSERVILKNTMSPESIDFMKNNSALTCAVIAVSSLMGDDVYLDFSCEGVVRVLVCFRSIYKYSENLFNLLLKLFYSEIEDDCILSMEYRNADIALYRTLLMRYILQLTLSPMNSSRKIRFSYNGRVDFKTFILRFYKFLNFRTNSVLMDKIVFEKYLTTRVVTECANKDLCMNPLNVSVKLMNGNSDELGYGFSTKRRHIRRFADSRKSDADHESTQPSPKSMREMEYDYSFDELDEYSDLPLNRILNVFGFLEYYNRSINTDNLKLSIKSEDILHNDKYFEEDYFFNLSFKLLGVLRNFMMEPRCFASDVLDLLSFKYYLRLCSNDFYNAVNTTLIYSDIRQVLDTNQFGEKVENAVLAQYFGEEDESNDFLESLGLLENVGTSSKERYERKKSWKLQFVDLLKLNNRYTKRMYYSLTHKFCSEFFKFIPDSFLPNLLCSWSSALPTDSVSTVRSEKVATARFVIFMLMCRICSLNPKFSHKFFSEVEPLVSAVNVILVNLEIVYKSPTSFSMCEVISDDEHTPMKKDPCIQSPQEFNELLSGDLDMSESNFYENLVTKYNTIKAENVKRLRERREEVRKRNREQVNLLLQVSWLFAKIMDKITNNIYKTIMDPSNSYVIKTDDSVMPYFLGKRKSFLYSMIDLLTLLNNTLSTIIRICVLSTVTLSDSSTSEYSTPKRNPYSDRHQGLIKLESSTEREYTLSQSYKDVSSQRNLSQKYESAKISPDQLETYSHSDIVSSIKSHKENIKSRLKFMSELQFAERYQPKGEETLSEYDSDGYQYISDPYEDMANGTASDGLEGFIDFETDQHLSMVTYSNKRSRGISKLQKLNVSKRLDMTDLRKEWRCIIKSQLI